MKRRTLITLAASLPLAARAQSARLPVVGFVVPGSPASHGKWIAAFLQRLRELGWIDGSTVTLDLRYAEGRNEKMAEIAADFVRLNAAVIVVSGSSATSAASRATQTIPIVFTAASAPVAIGLVASLAHPGGNITGLAQQNSQLAAKRLDLLREILPGLRRLALMANMGSPATAADIADVQGAANAVNLDLVIAEIRQSADIAPAFETLKGRADALYVSIDPLFSVHQVQMNQLALDARLPTLHGLRDYVVSGGLMSYGADFSDLYRRAGDYVDKVLHGAKPADLPVEQPTKFNLVVNGATAKALGLTLPVSLLARVDEFIE